jgi:hypothetical protein
MVGQLQEQLREENSDVLLFLRRLRAIKLDLDESTERNSSIEKIERTDRDFIRNIREVRSGGDVDIKHWAMGEETSLREPLVVSQNPVQVAIPFQNSAACNVYALLPIRSHGLPFAHNGPFQVTANHRHQYIYIKQITIYSTIINMTKRMFWRPSTRFTLNKYTVITHILNNEIPLITSIR